MKKNETKRVSSRNSLKPRLRKVRQQDIFSDALRLLVSGHYQAQVAKELGMSRKTLNYHTKKWVRQGVLIVDKPGKPTFYRTGPNWATDSPNFFSLGKKQKVRLHCLGLKFPHKCSEDFLRERLKGFSEIVLHHWSRFVGDIVGLKIDVTTKYVIVWASTIVDKNPERALLRAFLMCQHAVAALEKKYGLNIDLSNPEFHGRKPHYAVIDPVAEVVGKKVIISTEIGEIDESIGFGEIDFHSFEDVVTYLRMPSQVENVAMEIEEVRGEVDHLIQGSMTNQALLRANLGLLQALTRNLTNHSSDDFDCRPIYLGSNRYYNSETGTCFINISPARRRRARKRF